MPQLHLHIFFYSNSLIIHCSGFKIGFKKELPNSIHHYTFCKESSKYNIINFALLLEDAISTLATDSQSFLLQFESTTIYSVTLYRNCQMWRIIMYSFRQASVFFWSVTRISIPVVPSAIMKDALLNILRQLKTRPMAESASHIKKG